MTSAPRHPPTDAPGATRTADARRALACLDLTSLNDADTEADVRALCARADGPHGAVAAVCVWPRFAALARRTLPAHIAVAAVANFPDGSADVERARRDTRAIVDAGAQEVDVVLPYAALLRGDEAAVTSLLAAVRAACPGLTLKVILETGALVAGAERAQGAQAVNVAHVTRAAQLALAAGADFLKTSTGKIPVGATVGAASAMLQAIAAEPAAAARIGFKASGGVRTVADAAVYLGLVERFLGADAVTPSRFRLGASSLLDDIDTVLGGAAPADPATPAEPASPGRY